MAGHPKSFRFADDFAEKLGKHPNQTKYLEALVRLDRTPGYLAILVRRASGEFEAAWTFLRVMGWQRHELLTACQMLHGYAGLEGTAVQRGVKWVAVELGEGTSNARWTELVGTVTADDDIAAAVVVVAREFAAGNPLAVQRLSESP